MNYEIAVYPKREKLMDLAGSQDTAPIVMLNLLKFRDVAEYKDGRAEKISGREAYMRYANEMEKIIVANGGRFVFFGELKDVVIGDVEDLWDEVGLVEYSSAASFATLVTSPEVLAISTHRDAGLAGQLLIRSTLPFEHK